MPVPQPGANIDPDAMWSPALARGLIREDLTRSIRCCDGYTSLLEHNAPTRRSLAQRAMQSPLVAAIYERIWRPIMVAIMSLHGLSIDAERERAAAALHLDGDQRVLDVACGPGNFTSFFADKLARDGFAVGLDISLPMIERAVRDNSRPRAVYMHADALSLPFDDGTFDAVCCFAALHIAPEPMRMLHEMIRVLAPGGQIAVMTTYGRQAFLVRKALELGATICGVRVFDRTTVPAFFGAAGLTDIKQNLRGVSQFVTATRAS
jgi:SAM-dependent methyltransferase